MSYIKQALFGAAVVVLALTSGISAWAQHFPTKPIKLVVPGSPGTSTDALARFFADRLTTKLKTPVVIENKGGAGGLLAYAGLIKAEPDGYTIMASGLPRYLLPLSPDTAAKYDPVKDFSFIARIARTPLAFVVPTQSPIRTMDDLVQAMRAKPNDLTYSSQGVGSSAHICASFLNELTKTKARHVAYKESALAVTDVVGEHIDFTCQGSVGILPMVQAGRLRALAVTSAERWGSLPDVPTVVQAGVRGFEMSPGIEFIGPAGMPASTLQMLSDALMDIGKLPQYQEMVAKFAISADMVDHRGLTAMIPEEYEYWKRATSIAFRGQ